jgi:hypothetical protein
MKTDRVLTTTQTTSFTTQAAHMTRNLVTENCSHVIKGHERNAAPPPPPPTTTTAAAARQCTTSEDYKSESKATFYLP